MLYPIRMKYRSRFEIPALDRNYIEAVLLTPTTFKDVAEWVNSSGRARFSNVLIHKNELDYRLYRFWDKPPFTIHPGHFYVLKSQKYPFFYVEYEDTVRQYFEEASE